MAVPIGVPGVGVWVGLRGVVGVGFPLANIKGKRGGGGEGGGWDRDRQRKPASQCASFVETTL